MSSKRIADLPVKNPIDAMKLPTGGFGDYAITLKNLSDWLVNKYSLSTKEELKLVDETLRSLIDLKSDKEQTYTKQEVDYVLEQAVESLNTSLQLTNSDLNNLNTKVDSNFETLNQNKADKNKVVSSIGGKVGDLSYQQLKDGLGLGDLAEKNESEILKDSHLSTWDNSTQDLVNKRSNRSKLGNKVYLEHLPSSIDSGTFKYPQGACSVGDSVFVKIGANIGTVGTSTEAFIIVEYNFKTGAKIAETLPIATLGHHMLSGFQKDGKTYLVTSYQPASDTLNRSGVGVSLIEWKGSSTTISNVKQWELLNKNQRIGATAVDEKGEYIYLINSYSTLASAENTATYALTTNSNIQVHKLSDLNSNILHPIYSFDIENPTADGWNYSATVSGMSATVDHLYTVNGGSYSNVTISKHTVNGELVERIVTGGSRSSRPYSDRITESMFLYNSECEDIFTKDGKIYMIFAENWYGVGEFVRYNGKFYMARYGMVGKSPDLNINYWEKVFFTPSSYTEYSNTTTYVGRNTSVSDFKRVIVEVALKDDSNLDLLSENANVIPNIVNNAQGKVHYFGSLSTSKELNFGQYNVEQGSFQMNLSIVDNGLRLFDTRTPSLNSKKNSQLLSYKTPTVNNMALIPDADYPKDTFRVYSRYHNDSTNTTPFGYLARFENDGVETSVFHRDGRFYTYTDNAIVTAKFVNNGVEALSIYNNTNTVMLDTANTYMWFGKSSSGVHGSASIGINHDTKTMYPANDGGASLGLSNQRFERSYSKRRYYNATVFDDFGTGSPEGVVTAGIGSTYRNTSGGSGSTFFVKESGVGNTGWVAK